MKSDIIDDLNEDMHLLEMRNDIEKPTYNLKIEKLKIDRTFHHLMINMISLITGCYGCQRCFLRTYAFDKILGFLCMWTTPFVALFFVVILQPCFCCFGVIALILICALFVFECCFVGCLSLCGVGLYLFLRLGSFFNFFQFFFFDKNF